jgi:hypothetical protein
MTLRFNTLSTVLLPDLKVIKKSLIFLILLTGCPVFSQNSSAIEDVKKIARKVFEDEDYTTAYKMYSQLVANYPKDPEYNFKLGVCMIFAEPDKKKCLPYLQFAAKNQNAETQDIYFFLGKAYHINYLFDEAIKNYSEFKRTAPASKQKKLAVDREIKSCNSGKHLLSNLSDLQVISKRELNEADYFRAYSFKDLGGKLLVKPEEFNTSADKKKKDKSIVFLPKTGNRLYYSSYGNNTDNGKDIYYKIKLDNGGYGGPVKVNGINTEFDEDYPFLHPDGKTLYFASKGHKSMGGYDIFKSSYIEATDSWTQPVNLEFPINSPDDDYLYVTDSLENTAYFSTGRQSVPGKIDVLKINTMRKAIDVLVIKGKVLKENADQSLSSKITVKNIGDEKNSGIYYAEDNGNYSLSLSNGAKVSFTVETPGFKTQTQEISLPLAETSKPFKQSIAYVDGILKITNEFDEPVTDENYLQYLKVIEKKAKLEVNADENDVVAVSKGNDADAKGTTSGQLDQASQDSTSVVNNKQNKSLDNTQLKNMAKQDAVESKNEAIQLKKDSEDALEVGQKQKTEAEKKLTESELALKNTDIITDSEEKKSAIEKATVLKQDAEKEIVIANKILEFAKTLETDAAVKEKEAALNEQYARELEKAINSKNTDKESLANLEVLQKQLNDLSTQSSASENLFNTIKNNSAEKEKQIASLEKTNIQITSNIEEIKTEISNNDAELLKTKKKKDKEIINNQTTELKAQQTEKESQIAGNELAIKKLKEEIIGLKSELDIANKIRTESLASISNTTALPEIANKSDVTAIAKSNTRTDLNKTEKNKTIPSKNNLPKENNQPDYTPLTAATKSEAIVKLDKLNTQLNTNDNELFDFNAYQNPQAQNLRIEADAKINDAIVQQKKLKDAIVTSKQEIGNLPSANTSTQTSQGLMKEGDNLALKAQKLRTQANTLTGAAKEAKLKQAKKLDGESNENYIQAAELTKIENQSQSNLNQDAISKYIAENKTPINELEQAKQLNEVSLAELKKAGEIRDEAKNLINSGAKLGSLSNAEEIEAGAIQKQKAALDLLKKSNPELTQTLLTNTQTATTNTANSTLDSKLQAVNIGVSDLANIKIASYQKLYEANQLEVDQTFVNITKNKTILDKTPGFKSDFISGSTKIDNSKAIKQNSDSMSNPTEKLSGLTAAIKKQLEGIKQLNSLNAKLNQAALKENALLAQQNLQKSNAAESKSDSTLTENNIEKNAIVETSQKSSEINAFAQQDTTTGEVLTYLNKKATALNDPLADAAAKKSLSAIANTENEIRILDNKINNPGNAASNLVPSAEQKTKANALLVESESLSTKSFEARKEAETKTGEDKDKLLAAATDMDNQSQAKKIEASGLVERAYVQDFQTNAHAIEEMLSGLKTDNAEMFADINNRNKEIINSVEKAKTLREEANSLPNKAAQLGALSNVEEKEAELIQRQEQLISDLKKQYPNYEVKPFDPLANETPETLRQNRTQLLEKQYADYTNLTNAYTLEYEASKNKVPEKLNTNQRTIKKNAENLNAESKRLLVEASKEQNESKKIKLLAIAAKSGNAAIEQLNQLVKLKTELAANQAKSNSAIDDLEAIGNSINANNNNRLKTKTQKTNVVKAPEEKIVETKKANAKNIIKIEGLEVISGNAYNDTKPIPIDSKVEDGLIFRVQIGAFRTKLANSTFKGLSPMNAETTPNGYTRYTAGNFNKLENANAVKNDLRTLGYRDAFVVVFYNGKRITLSEALSILEKEGKTIDNNAPQTAGISESTNIPKATAARQNPNVSPQDNVLVVTKELEQINGLLYTVQIGVYTKQITSRQLLNLKPIFTERMNNGLFRYTAGIYNNAERLVADKRKVIDLGVKDAFVSAYLNGKRIPFIDGRTRQNQDSSIKMEPENPIVFSEAESIIANAALQNTQQTESNSESAATSTVLPFKNNVSKYPEATAENGIKATEEGLTFKVQIGAYSKEVPTDVASKFLSITTWPIENTKISGLFIYNIGCFSAAKFAKTLRDEAIQLGITDAFISVYNDGIKLSGADAEAALRK